MNLYYELLGQPVFTAEYHGFSGQVYYDVYVASATRFRDFEFDGYTYKYISAKSGSGVEEVKYSGGVRVTDREMQYITRIKTAFHRLSKI